MKIKLFSYSSKTRLLGFAVLAFLALAGSASPPPFSVDWYKVSGGGGSSTNLPFVVSGTIGQHDAGGPMSGGAYQVTGGFWSIYAVQMPGAPILTITYTNNKAIVSWPQSVTGFTLQTNNNPVTTNWSNWVGTVVNNTVTNSPLTGNLYSG